MLSAVAISSDAAVKSSCEKALGNFIHSSFFSSTFVTYKPSTAIAECL